MEICEHIHFEELLKVNPELKHIEMPIMELIFSQLKILKWEIIDGVKSQSIVKQRILVCRKGGQANGAIKMDYLTTYVFVLTV